jgi:hypothetical protein
MKQAQSSTFARGAQDNDRFQDNDHLQDSDHFQDSDQFQAAQISTAEFKRSNLASQKTGCEVERRVLFER